jgi:hypothetical protein
VIPPIQHIEQIDPAEADRTLISWGHKMGPCNRPMGLIRAHGMFAHGSLCALTITADLVNATCAGFTRQEAVELARLCAARPDLCRPMLRLWREFIFPCFGRPWAVSYQDEKLHTGNTYRFDGWGKAAGARQQWHRQNEVGAWDASRPYGAGTRTLIRAVQCGWRRDRKN